MNARQIKDKKRREQQTKLDLLREEESIFNDEAATWSFASDGYEWRDLIGIDSNGHDFKGRAITPKTLGRSMGLTTANPSVLSKVPDVPITLCDYFPLAEHGLFFKFGEISPDEDSILRFVCRHGLLGIGAVSLPIDDTKKCNTPVGEPFGVWSAAISDMKRALQLWRLIEQKDAKGLYEFLRWHPIHGWRYCETNGPNSLPVRLPLELKKIPRDRPLEVAMRYVQTWINRHLIDNCPVLVVKSESRGCFLPRVIPSNLLGCVWWQFARTFFGEIAYKFCKICNQPIEVSQEGRQTNREFCSGACKQKDQRARVNQAKQLAKSGKKSKAIAKHMGVAETIVNNWLKKRERKL